MSGQRMHPDTPARMFEIIDGYAAGKNPQSEEIIAIIPTDELADVTAFALGMLGALYTRVPEVRAAIDLARRGTGAILPGAFVAK